MLHHPPLLLFHLALLVANSVSDPINLLFIVTDDLRPMIQPWSDMYGVAAPNIAKLAEESVVFKNAYVQQAVCGPSRNSFLTGRRPDTTKVWNFQTSFRTSGAVDRTGLPGARWNTLPEALKKAGYTTLGIGKVFHPGSPRRDDCVNPHPPRASRSLKGGRTELGQEDLQQPLFELDGRDSVAASNLDDRKHKSNCKSWSTSFLTNRPTNIKLGPSTITSCDPKCALDSRDTDLCRCQFNFVSPDAQIFDVCLAEKVKGLEKDKIWCDLHDDACTDKWIADVAVELLPMIAPLADQALAAPTSTKPFALFVGFHKPHPLWAIPRRFHDMYMDMPLPNSREAPIGAPDMAFYSCGVINSRSSVGGPNCDNPDVNPFGAQCQYVVPHRPLDVDIMREIRASYAGGLTWTDSQIGRVLDKLRDVGAWDNTVVVFFSDHGWALGEHGMWCKQANYELQTRIPMTIRVPSALGKLKGKQVKQPFHSTDMVELVDLYPTVLDLLSVHSSDEGGLEGTSLVPILVGDTWNAQVSYSQYPRCMNSTDLQKPPYIANTDGCTKHPSNEFTHMGYTMRTPEWRYTEWPRWNGTLLQPDWSKVEGVELFTHVGDNGSCFDCFEGENVAMKQQYRHVVKDLSEKLRSWWRAQHHRPHN